MKIAITGHTKGIGQAIYDLLGQEHDVIGYSRSNGYNINQPEIIFEGSQPSASFAMSGNLVCKSLNPLKHF